MAQPATARGSPTTKVAVQTPDGVVSVKPQETAGWKIAITEGPYEEPVELHGDTITPGVNEVWWTANIPLPDNHMQQFGLSMKMPDKPGETLYFPVVQTCEQGVHRSITIPVEDEEQPAADADESAEALPAVQAGQVDAGDDSDTLALVALVVGIAGLATGRASLVRKRR